MELLKKLFGWWNLTFMMASTEGDGDAGAEIDPDG